eukprot:CAMPEP_0113701888 /NCGR_PEP_ID=MMETSP0038_2-20120614/24846_1 /TAXON_ID=2898 /ORGANISM="Cryptomonas paramecium" /LENGTH=939 /DNA_ID=CAMNT_0000625873 /DNA_START=794 /DNA_END=3610 /DNA_ORIENTATION=+ /assembly_acc=CAM_ASM_000170
MLKAVENAAYHHRLIVHSLIPANVLERIAAKNTDNGFIGSEIRECAIMFCSLSSPSNIGSDNCEAFFGFLDQVFCDFDDAVERNNLFKYQHVGEWYIVACPRACLPFDEEEQAEDYPLLYIRSMLLLADELRTISRRHSFNHAEPMLLRVGLSFGPVAGAVIGTLKSFYCLYGDTVNTAARMCKLAEPDTVRCTPEFAALGRNCQASAMSFHSCGISNIKGKGLMETFSIEITPLARVQLTLAAADFLGGDQDAPRLPTQVPMSRRRSMWGRVSSLHRLMSTDSIGILSRSPLQLRHSLRANPPFVKVEGKRVGKIDVAQHGKLAISWQMRFTNSRREARFLASQAPIISVGIFANFAVHIAALALQFHAFCYPDYSYDFVANGPVELDRQAQFARTAMGVHLFLSGCVVLAFLGVALRHQWLVGSQFFAWARAALSLLRASFLAVSFAVGNLLGTLGWTVMFSTTACIFMEGILGAIGCQRGFMASVAHMLVIAIAGAACAFEWSSQPAWRVLEQFSGLIPELFICVSLSALVNFSERHRWRRARLLQHELSNLWSILCKLMPKHFARKMLELDSDHLQDQADTSVSLQGLALFERCSAAVLQMDICGFTSLSQTMPAMELARTVHNIFCRLDRKVVQLRLFKMDTIGDAYIVAGLIPAATESRVENVRRTRRACSRVMRLAAMVLEELRGVREETGLSIRARLGIGFGEVVVGALGRLQPRIHIRGPGMQTAEAMEQTGRESAVHASESFVRALWAGAGLTGALCSGGAVGDGSGASDGWLSGRFSGEGDDASPFKGGLLADEDDSDDDSHAEQAADDSILGAAGPTWHVPPEVSVHSATLTSKLLGLSRSGGSWIRNGFLLPRAGSASSSGSVTGPIAPSRWLTGGMPKRAPLAGVVVETPRSPSPWATTGTLHVRGDGEDAGEGRDGRRASWSEL